MASVNKANLGEVDAELFRINNMEKKYTNLIKVPVVINAVTGVVLSTNKEFPIDGWNSLRPYYIGIRHGVFFTKKGTEGMNRLEVTDLDQIFKMLESGRLDIAVITELTAKRELIKFGDSDIKILYPPVQVVNLYHYLHKDNIHLLEPLTKELLKMEQSGEIKRIREKYIETLDSTVNP